MGVRYERVGLFRRANKNITSQNKIVWYRCNDYAVKERVQEPEVERRTMKMMKCTGTVVDDVYYCNCWRLKLEGETESRLQALSRAASSSHVSRLR